MNLIVKEMWIEALESGEYKQGMGCLNSGDKFCCLGVLCELAYKEGVVQKHAVEGYEETFYDNADDVLPFSVKEWAGLSETNPEVEIEDESGDLMNETLIELNDSHELTFKQIAEIIKHNL